MWKTNVQQRDGADEQVIRIGPDIEFHILKIGANKVSVAVKAPEGMKIERGSKGDGKPVAG